MKTITVNTHRLLCPMPVIRTQDAIAELEAGDEVQVLGTDPGMKQDIPAWCRINGHRVIGMEENDDEIRIMVRVGDS